MPNNNIPNCDICGNPLFTEIPSHGFYNMSIIPSNKHIKICSPDCLIKYGTDDKAKMADGTSDLFTGMPQLPVLKPAV